MDAIAEKQSRNSRWTRDPVVGRAGAAVAVYPTERDIEIFKLLVRFRYLPSDYIHAFVGGSAKALLHRLNLLSRKPNLYLARPHQQRQNANANYRPLIYELDERGSRVLRERDLAFLPKSYHRNFSHELMVAQTTASVELGTRANRNIRLITWPEILASDNTPKATREATNPAAIRVTFSLRGETHSGEIIADGRPFGLERTIDGARSYLFFPGIEADCATEPLDTGVHRTVLDRPKVRRLYGYRRARHSPLALRLPQLPRPLHHHQRHAHGFHDGAAQPLHRRSRLQDVFVQDLSELHIA